jgi:transcriptional regulator of acetoin/glycerol metabolism
MGETEVSTQRSEETADESKRTTLVLRSVLPGEDLLLDLSRERGILGRGAGADVRLGHEGVSRQHAELGRRGPVVSIRDLGSTNGTWVSGRRVEHAALEEGVVVRLGEWLGLVEAYPAGAAKPRPFGELAPDIWGGARLERTLCLLLSAAGSNVPVVLVGRTGTGKERFARALHHRGGAERPFHAINCAALAPSLAEAELFGYRRGAFTGAERDYSGQLLTAQGGLLFLDEIADLAPSVQAKLLRALDTGELAAIGESRPRHFRAQVVASCQVSLSELVAAGRFREDLAARLSGVVVRLPDLRERTSDVPALFHHFLAVHSGRTAPSVSTGLYERLCLHPWPGNVRELEMLARQLLAVHGLEPTLRRSHLPELLRPQNVASNELVEGAERNEQDVAEFTRALSGAAGNVTLAAERAGISRQRAYRLISSRRLATVVSAARDSAPESKNESEP